LTAAFLAQANNAVEDPRLIDFAAVAATISPALFGAILEQFRQSDFAKTNDTLKDEAEV